MSWSVPGQVPTIVIFQGDAEVYVGDASLRLDRLSSSPPAPCAQVFLVYSDCDITAIFATEAGTVEQAENEATGEAGKPVFPS